MPNWLIETDSRAFNFAALTPDENDICHGGSTLGTAQFMQQWTCDRVISSGDEWKTFANYYDRPVYGQGGRDNRADPEWRVHGDVVSTSNAELYPSEVVMVRYLLHGVITRACFRQDTTDVWFRRVRRVRPHNVSYVIAATHKFRRVG